MADEALIDSSEPRDALAPLRRGWRDAPLALQIGVYYLLARVVTTAFLVIAAGLSGASSRFGAHASVADLMIGWDAQWYWFTAVHGYPRTLPLTDAGAVAENQWAFMPIYAYLSQGVGLLLGAWGAGAVVISLVAGYLSCLVLYRMLRPQLVHAAALWAVVFFACGPVAAMFQVGYAESLFLLWLFLALLAVQHRRYGWLYALIPLMAFTRPGVLAFALFLGLFGIWRWARRRSEPLRAREIIHLVAAAAMATATGFAWQLIAGIVTGDPRAYLATELAWRRNWLPDSVGGFVPFDGFVQATAFWFRTWGLGEVAGYVVLAVGVAAIAAALVLLPVCRRLGIEIRLWSASYLLYILAVFFPQSSIFRLLLPLSPLWGAMAIPPSRAWRVGVLLVCLVSQWWWIYNMYALGNTYWQIP